MSCSLYVATYLLVNMISLTNKREHKKHQYNKYFHFRNSIQVSSVAHRPLGFLFILNGQNIWC